MPLGVGGCHPRTDGNGNQSSAAAKEYSHRLLVVCGAALGAGTGWLDLLVRHRRASTHAALACCAGSSTVRVATTTTPGIPLSTYSNSAVQVQVLV
jgi:hypothetical protein